MRSLISNWAAAYNLPDPMVRADEINATDAARPAAAAAAFRNLDTICQSANEVIRWAHLHLADAWTAPQPTVALALVAQMADEISADCSVFADTAETIAQVITEAHRDVATALAAAETAIATEGLQYWHVDPDLMAHVIRGRCALVMGMNTALHTIGRRLDSAVSAVSGPLANDPRRNLPPGMTPSSSQAASDRDHAHRFDLAHDLGEGDRADRVTAAAVAATLRQISTAGLTAQLLQYSAHSYGGQGSTAIAIGDIATADTVAVIVPGIGNAPTAMGGTAELAIDLQRATEAAAAAGSTHATVIWFGYDIPASWPREAAVLNPVQMLVHAWSDTASATNAAQAAIAGPQLGTFTRQLRRSMDQGATLTLIGHSYGSTVVSQAARSLGSDSGIDDIVLLASPGAGYQVSSAADYGAVAADHVYTLAFPADPVAQHVTDSAAGAVNPLGTFGTDPNSSQFGAQRITVPSNNPVTPGLNFRQHGLDNYLSGPALGAVAGVVAGNYAQVPTRRKEK